LDGGRLTARVDRGDVPALAPDEVRDADTGTVQIGGSRIVIADLARRPPRAAVTLRADGDLSDVLGLLDNRPFRLLDRLGRTRNLADGRIEALVTAELPLRPGNAPADIEWGVDADLIDVVATEIVPDRTLRADRLSLNISTAAIEIGGDMTYEGIPFSGTWRQALPPPSTVPLDPTAPPRPRQPLPEPGIVTGTIRATPEGLARIGLRFAALDLRGETEASIAIRLPSGQPAEMTVSSDLRGLSMAFPAIDWSKGAGTAADLELEARLGSPPLIRNLSFDAPGLRASGSVTLRTGGALDRARFDRVRTSWFEGPVTLIGRGAGVPPAISIPSGTADLRAAPFGGGQGGGSGGGGTSSPLEVALNRLQVTDNIALTDLRADLLDGQGRFNGRVNDGQPIAGILAREAGNTVVQISGDDAGGVLRSAGLFRDARGGALRLTLRGTGRAGTYGGQLRIGNIRVRNAPALASLLQTLSVVGILEQLTGEGLFFASVESDFTLRPGDIAVRRASAVGPSMSITADGTYDTGARRLDLQGVVSPIYIVNGLFGALFSRQDEGLFGFTYRLRGSVDDPQVGVNPMSILTPGIFREIFRRPPPS
ncbi:MAG: AsmA-like C-terminal region-containing protein, partial [Pseudomonadota bacterium]